MQEQIVAKASTTIAAPVTQVWDALINPEMIERYMFGARVVSDWKQGSPITWRGEWKGKPYEDRGVILEIEPQRRLRYSHFSPLAGLPDAPENYHAVTIDLTADNEQATRVALSQDNNKTNDARDHAEKNWNAMLANLKKVIEKNRIEH